MKAPAPGVNPGRAAVLQQHPDNTAAWLKTPEILLERQLEHIAADDRRWFNRHTTRRWRMRPAMPGEETATWVAVRSFGPARLRFPLYGYVPLGLTDRGTDLFMTSILSLSQARLLDEIEAIVREHGR